MSAQTFSTCRSRLLRQAAAYDIERGECCTGARPAFLLFVFPCATDKIMSEPYATRRDPRTGKVVKFWRKADYVAGRKRAEDAARKRHARIQARVEGRYYS